MKTTTKTFQFPEKKDSGKLPNDPYRERYGQNKTMELIDFYPKKPTKKCDERKFNPKAPSFN